MKKLTKILLALFTTVALIVIFYYFFPHVWGEIVWPKEYDAPVKKYAEQYSVNPNLIYAFIYTESRSHKDSVSGVGARGLMQIMPSTGASIAEELGDSGYSVDKLFDPDTNIRYGTWYIAGLLNKYGGNIDLTAAAYNAGSGRADQWKDTGAALPYETVNFIAKINDTKAVYDKVYGTWWATPEVKKPNPFYQGVTNISAFVHTLILGK